MNNKKHSSTTFQEEWFTNTKYKLWIGKSKDGKYARCILCCKDIDISSMGSSALDSHSTGKKHKQRVGERSQYSDIFFKKKTDSSCIGSSNSSLKKGETVTIGNPTQTGTIGHFQVSQNSLNAEILWCLKVVNGHLSYNSCSNLAQMFQYMFPDSEVAAQFSLGKSKCRYMLLFGIAPHFKSILKKDINTSSFYSVSFDESLNSVIQKCQMDVNIRYWNDSTNKVETRYFDSKFLERPNAEHLFNCINEAIAGLKEDKLLQLAMDGPSVNWNVLDMLDDSLVEKGFGKTINIGSCAQHIVHGALQTGISKTEWKIDQILKSMFWILQDSPARRDIYIREGEMNTFPLRFVFNF